MGNLKTKIQKFDTKRSVGSLTITQSPIWQNWNPIENLGPSNLRDARDLGQMVDRCLKTDGLGYEIFNVSKDDHSVSETSEELHAKFYAGVPIKKNQGSQETFYSNAKAKRLVGFVPQHSWQKHLNT